MVNKETAMLSQAAILEAIKLTEQYEMVWGTPLDTTALPSTLTQEKLCLVLRQIIESGDSILVGYQKVRDIELRYYNSIDWTRPYRDKHIFDSPCPFCGKAVRILFYGTYSQSHVIKCETDHCLTITFRGL